MPFPQVGQTLYGGWTQEGEGYADLKSRFTSYNTKAAGLICDSVADDRAALNTLVNVTMQPNGGQLDVVGIVRIASAVSIPNNVTIRFMDGAYFAPDVAVVVTILGRLAPTQKKIFGGGGTFALSGPESFLVLPEWWGTAGDGVTNDTTPIQASLTAAAGRQVYLSGRPNGYLVTSLTMGTASAFAGELNGTVLKTQTNAVVLDMTADNQTVFNIKVQGIGGAAGNQTALNCNGFLNFTWQNVFAYNVNTGFEVQNTSGAYKGGRVLACEAFSCTTGFHSDVIGEYVVYVACLAVGCVSGFAIRGGNGMLVGCSGNDNTNGIVLEAGANDSHGVAVGCNFNHNSAYAVLTAAIVNGFDFVGCHMYGGEIYLNGAQDVTFQGGTYSVVNWRCANTARGRVLGALVLAANGDGVIVDNLSYFYFDEYCTRAGGVKMPLTRMLRGGYVTASPPLAGQNVPNAATTTVLWSALIADRASNSQQTANNPAQIAYTFLDAVTGIFTNRGLGGGKIAFRMMMKLTGVGAAPTQLYANIKKNGAIIHPFITSATMVVGGVTYTVFNWNGRIQADVGDTITVEIVNNTGAAMTLANSDSLLVAEGL